MKPVTASLSLGQFLKRFPSHITVLTLGFIPLFSKTTSSALLFYLNVRPCDRVSLEQRDFT